MGPIGRSGDQQGGWSLPSDGEFGGRLRFLEGRGQVNRRGIMRLVLIEGR